MKISYERTQEEKYAAAHRVTHVSSDNESDVPMEWQRGEEKKTSRVKEKIM